MNLKLISSALAASVLLLAASCERRPLVSDSSAGAAMDVISRTLGRTPANLAITIDHEAGNEYYSTEVSGRILKITASSPTAACRAFYDWCGKHHLGLSTWSVNNLRLPRRLSDEAPERVDSPVKYVQYLNVCTYGYTMPYWGWEQWEKELDRMALHGINMMLAPVGSEAIFARVWRKLGLSEEEIDAFETGPAHLPWFRMGNMSGLDGGLSDDYYERSIALAHKMLDRMAELGIHPVLNAFAGFVPDGIKRVFPDVEILPTGWGDGPAYVSSFLSPETGLFQKISKMYIEEWESEFGKGEFYLADSFNEMKVPFAPQGTKERFDQIASYGRNLFNSIHEANPDATWVLQGWIFGYQRNIWDPESIRALFSEVPDDKFLLLDLSTDYNHDVWEIEYTWNYAPALYGKPWIYSTVPNFGGRTAPVGNLEYYLNGHLNALSSPNKGRLCGIGSAPEGVENNEIVYELIYDAPWNTEKRDIMQRLRDYSINRYGACPPEIEEFWKGMLSSSYSFCSSQVVYRLQRKPFFLRGGRYDLTPTHFKAIESFFAAGKTLGKNDAYKKDLALWAGYYAFGKAEILAEEITRCYRYSDTAAADSLRPLFREAMLAADRFLESNPLSRLERWTGFARRWSDDPAQQDAYETNARRLITTWGAGRIYDSLDDYAARIWSGLIRDYYLPRWEHWFDALSSGEPFDFDAWEYKFAEESKGVSPVEPCSRLLDAANTFARDFAGLQQRRGELPGWTPFHIKEGSQRFSYMLYPEDFESLAGIRLHHICGEGSVIVNRVRLRGAKVTILDRKDLSTVIGKDSPDAQISLDIPEGGPRKYIYLDVYVSSEKALEDSDVSIGLIRK